MRSLPDIHAYLWEKPTKKDKWGYCALKNSIKGRKLIYPPSFLLSPVFQWSKFSPIGFNSLIVFGPHHPAPLATRRKTSPCPSVRYFYPSPEVMRDTKYSRCHWPQRARTLWLVSSWSFVIIAAVENYTWGSRGQLSQERLKNYMPYTRATKTCKSNELKKQKTRHQGETFHT